MLIRIYTDINSIPLTGAEWNSLVSQSLFNTVFQRSEWIHNWWKIFGNKYSLYFLVATENEKTVGFAPLMISTGLFGRKILRFIGDENSDYCDFVSKGAHGDVIQAMVQKILENKGDWDSLRLVNIPSTSLSNNIIRHLCGLINVNCVVKHSTESFALIIDGHLDDVKAILKKYSVRRTGNYFARQGSTELIHIRSAKEASNYWDIFFDQHVDRCRNAGRKSSFLSQEYRDFFINTFEDCCDDGIVNFTVLKLNNKPIAFHYGFEYNNKLIWYKPTFDTTINKGSPGTLLIKYLIEYSIKKGLAEFDMTIGSEPFKLRFTNTQRYNNSVFAYQNKWHYTISSFSERLYLIAKNTLKSISPHIHSN